MLAIAVEVGHKWTLPGEIDVTICTAACQHVRPRLPDQMTGPRRSSQVLLSSAVPVLYRRNQDGRRLDQPNDIASIVPQCPCHRVRWRSEFCASA